MAETARPRRIPVVRGPKQRMAEVERRAARERAADDAQAKQAEAEAYEGWKAGRVVPHRIPLALDIHQLYGPEVDEACGTREPAVDKWEAGERYPSWEQLKLLAELTGYPVGFFIAPEHGKVQAFKPDDQVFICYRGRKNWNPVVKIPEPVLRCKPETIAAAMRPHYEQEELF